MKPSEGTTKGEVDPWSRLLSFQLPSVTYEPPPREERIRKRKRLTRRCDMRYSIQRVLSMNPEIFVTYNPEKVENQMYKLLVQRKEEKKQETFRLFFYPIPTLLATTFPHFINFVALIQKVNSKHYYFLSETFSYSVFAEAETLFVPLGYQVQRMENLPTLPLEEWARWHEKVAASSVYSLLEWIKGTSEAVEDVLKDFPFFTQYRD
jgi:hypothetical protein